MIDDWKSREFDVETNGYSARPTFWRMKNRDLVWDFREAADYVFWTCGTDRNENIYACEQKKIIYRSFKRFSTCCARSR